MCNANPESFIFLLKRIWLARGWLMGTDVMLVSMLEGTFVDARRSLSVSDRSEMCGLVDGLH